MKKFVTKYGYFTDDGREYVITNYRTPRPWINVISNGDYGLVVSQVNGGFSWITHSNLNRLTRWQQDLIQDNWGKYFYLRDDENGEYWSPTVKPVMREPDSYQCRHGIGYTTFQSLNCGIEASLRLFVPFGDNLEIWTLQLKNSGERPRQIGIYTYFEWCLGAAPDNHREFHKTFFETEFDQYRQVLLARKRLWEVPSAKGDWNASWDRIAYLACSEPVDEFESDKESFIGNLGDLSRPQALQTGRLTNTKGKWNDAIGSLKKTIHLNPGEEKVIHFYLGAEIDHESIFDQLRKYRQQETIEAAFANVRQEWDNILSATTVQTPDEALNLLTNIWLKYQAICGRIWARAAYYQQSGAYGFRDQLQDSQIFLHSQPEQTKKQILLHARHQFSEGKVLHWWHPITEVGHDANASDDLLWLSFVTTNYLKETADWTILETLVPFYNESESSSLLDHCLRAIDLALSRFSLRGFPLILGRDWNDGLSAVGLQGQGESVWLAHFLYLVLQEMLPVLQQVGQLEKRRVYQQRAEKLKQAINTFGWDGQWFWRASKDNGELLGSHENSEGKIFLNAQTWAVIADSIFVERKKLAMQAVEQWLDSKVGPLLLYPAYRTPDPDIGYLSRYAPGLRENGGVYTHAATWAVWAECLLKHHARAYQLYQKINPVYNGGNPDEYCAEPYVTPGNIDGPDSPHYGRGGWTWYTGSAAWMYRITLDYLLGVRADYSGLIIDPCLPPGWKEVRVQRLFRGAQYFIHITSNGAEGAQIRSVRVNDQDIAGNVVEPQPAGSKADVEVSME